MLAGIFDTVELDVQHNSVDVGIAVQDCPLNDDVSLALWAAFRGEESTSVPATDDTTSPPRILKTDGPNLSLHATGLSPGSLNIGMAHCDKSSLDKRDCVQKPQLIDDRERNSTGPIVGESSLMKQDHTSRAAFDISAKTAPSEGSTCDRSHFYHGIRVCLGC